MRWFYCWMVVATLCLGIVPAYAQTTLLETATQSATGQLGGAGIDGGQFLGARFFVAERYRVTRLEMHANANNGLFMAIVPLASATAFPTYDDLHDKMFAGLVSTTNPGSAVLSLTTDLVLPAGHYAFLTGGDLFGATGHGYAPTDGTSIGTPSYFHGNNSANWQNQMTGFPRFVVQGELAPAEEAPAVPEPSAMLLFLPALGHLLWVHHRRSGLSRAVRQG